MKPKKIRKKLYLFFIDTIINMVYNIQVNKNYIKQEKLRLLLSKIKKKVFYFINRSI